MEPLPSSANGTASADAINKLLAVKFGHEPIAGAFPVKPPFASAKRREFRSFQSRYNKLYDSCTKNSPAQQSFSGYCGKSSFSSFSTRPQTQATPFATPNQPVKPLSNSVAEAHPNSPRKSYKSPEKKSVRRKKDSSPRRFPTSTPDRTKRWRIGPDHSDPFLTDDVDSPDVETPLVPVRKATHSRPPKNKRPSVIDSLGPSSSLKLLNRILEKGASVERRTSKTLDSERAISSHKSTALPISREDEPLGFSTALSSKPSSVVLDLRIESSIPRSYSRKKEKTQGALIKKSPLGDHEKLSVADSRQAVDEVRSYRRPFQNHVGDTSSASNDIDLALQDRPVSTVSTNVSTITVSSIGERDSYSTQDLTSIIDVPVVTLDDDLFSSTSDVLISSEVAGSRSDGTTVIGDASPPLPFAVEALDSSAFAGFAAGDNSVSECTDKLFANFVFSDRADCPICLSNGIVSKLFFSCLSFKEGVWLCRRENCYFPLGLPLHRITAKTDALPTASAAEKNLNIF